MAHGCWLNKVEIHKVPHKDIMLASAEAEKSRLNTNIRLNSGTFQIPIQSYYFWISFERLPNFFASWWIQKFHTRVSNPPTPRHFHFWIHVDVLHVLCICVNLKTMIILGKRLNFIPRVYLERIYLKLLKVLSLTSCSLFKCVKDIQLLFGSILCCLPWPWDARLFIFNFIKRRSARLVK